LVLLIEKIHDIELQKSPDSCKKIHSLFTTIAATATITTTNDDDDDGSGDNDDNDDDGDDDDNNNNKFRGTEM
jgi:hypothetical protein